MNGVDLNQFQFDYDQTWAVMFFRYDGTLLARYGTRGETDGMKYNSLEGFTSTIRSVLQVDKNWRPSQKTDYARKLGPKFEHNVPEKIPSASMKSILARKKDGQQSCIHCHNIYDAQRDVAITEEKYDPMKRFKYPLPQNIGLEMDIGSGVKIANVVPESAAASAGLKAGHQIVGINGQPIHSIADVQFVLHRAAENAEIDIEAVDSSNRRVTAAVSLQPGWRTSDISWRASMYGMPPKPGLWVEATEPSERRRLGIARDKLALTIKGVFGNDVRKAGLKKNDVIIQFGKETERCAPGEFHAHLRLNYFEPNATLELKILRGGKTVEQIVTFANK